MRFSVFRLLAVVALGAMFARPALAQNTITLDGSVTAEGKPLAGARVTVVNTATQETVQTGTRQDGDFRVLGLFSGTYTVTVRSLGFKPSQQTVQLVIGQRAHLEFAMEQGATEIAATTITEQAVKQVEVQRMSVSAPVLKAEIQDLPINARGAMNLAGVVPGIKTYATQQGRTIPAGGAAPDLRYINFYLDGVELKSLYNGNLVGIPQTGSPLPQEALEEFRVYLNPYDAEYSHAGSYVISAVGRRGTNTWAGSAFGFLQNQSMIVKNAFQKTVPNYGRTQLGLNLRGPLEKDKLFLAFSYELAQTDNYIDVIPATTSSRWTPYAGSFKAPNTNHTAYTRLTYLQNSHNTWDAMFSARLMTGQSNFGGSVAQPGGITQNYKIYTGQLRHTWTSGGNFVNEASLQTVIWNHDEEPIQPGPQLSYPGLTTGTSGFPLILKETHLRLIDRMTWTVDNASGSHLIKAGVELSNIAASQTFPVNRNGSFSFPTDTSTMPNAASIAVGFTDPNGISDSQASATGVVTGLYVNDEWTMAPNFVLSIGLRHDAELNTMDNGYTVPWASDPTLQAIPVLQNYLNTGHRKNNLGNFGPRLSFSWDPWKQNRTFIRGGYGIIYDRVASFIGFQERRNSTWRTYNFVNPGTTDPSVLRQRVISGLVTGAQPILVKENMKTPYNEEMSIGIGHQLTPEIGLNLDYVRQHMRNIYVQWNPNYFDKTRGARALTSSYGDIILWDDFGESQFSSIMAQVTWQRAQTRLNFAYTLGWYESNFDGNISPAYAYPSLFTMQRNTDDERHRFVLSELSPIGWGFELSTITTIASPRPFLVTDGRDLNNDNNFTDDYPNGVRTMMPSQKWDNWYRTVDVRITRPLYTWDGKKVSFSADIFNFFNWSSNSGYQGRMLTATGTPLSNFGNPNGAFAARQGQVGMRIDW